MKIHAEINTPDHRIVLVETAGSSGSRRYGEWVMLRTVRLPAGHDYKHARQAGAEVIESWEVDARSQGPASNYGRTLKAMTKELADHAWPQQIQVQAVGKESPVPAPSKPFSLPKREAFGQEVLRDRSVTKDRGMSR
jgi:hypothetical protein